MEKCDGYFTLFPYNFKPEEIEKLKTKINDAEIAELKNIANDTERQESFKNRPDIPKESNKRDSGSERPGPVAGKPEVSPKVEGNNVPVEKR
jgi:hypothetical protein